MAGCMGKGKSMSDMVARVIRRIGLTVFRACSHCLPLSDLFTQER